MTEFPRTLTPVDGPYAPARVFGAAEGMGEYGPATCALVADGFLQPDLITGMTLALMARQPRKPRTDGDEKKASAIAGGVWVREQFTIHRPIAHDDPWRVQGEATGSLAKNGRLFTTTASRSYNSSDEHFATNLTTGLMNYKQDPDLVDASQGLALDDTPTPAPDWEAASSNPHLGALRALKGGERFGGERVLVSLAMMAARDTDQPDNPIHSDPEQARKAGLGRPIAGGSHVLAFALEPVMAALGTQVLLHGAHFDLRWKSPTESDVAIIPVATVTASDSDKVVIDLVVDLEAGPTAMVGTVTIPIS